MKILFTIQSIFLLLSISFHIFAMEICELGNLKREEPVLNEKNEKEKESRILNFMRQFKDLRKQNIDAVNYEPLAMEIYKQQLEVNHVILGILQLKKKNALNKMSQEWNIKHEDINFLMQLYAHELGRNDEDNSFSYILQAPQHRIEYFKEQVKTSSFEKLMSKTVSQCSAKKFIVEFGNFDDSISLELRHSDQEGALSFGPFSGTIRLQLSDKFFETSSEEQEFTMGHEAIHAIMFHGFLNWCLKRYCAHSIVLEHYGENMPSMLDWINKEKNKESWKRQDKILEDNKEDVPCLMRIMAESPSFLSFSRAAEYEADTIFPLIDIETAKYFEIGMKKSLKTKSDEPPNEKTHPFPEKRIRWITGIRKLLEAEQKLKSILWEKK